MSNEKAIPQGYMTVGEVAKKMGVTVRTLQYYDKENLLSPSAESLGGRRLYCDKDMVQLHQILSLKHLGFSLSDIKNRLIPLDTPTAVAGVLAEQAAAVRGKLAILTETLKELEALQAEVLQMQTVNFKKYADIIVNLQLKNDFYWLIKHFDDETFDYIRGRFTKDSALAMIETFDHLLDEAIELQRTGAPPESERAQALAAAFWNMVTEFTGGDMRMLPKLMELGGLDGQNNEWKQKQALANVYIGSALDIYFTKLGVNPFEEESQ